MPLIDSTDTLTDSVYINILRSNSEPVLYEEADWFVLLTNQPRNEGHLLIIPKQQVAKFYELPLDVLERGFQISTLLSRMLQRIYQPSQVALFIKGFSVDNHAHIHVTPAYVSEDLDVDPSSPYLEATQMYAIADKLKPEIEKALSHE